MQEKGNVALPGFEELIESKAEADSRDVGADLRQKVFTAERLALEYPGKYALAARAFFEKSRSAESISDILQISPQTMHAIIERECAARGVFEIKQHIRIKAASAAHKALCRLHELLDDEVAVRRAGITGLTSAIKALKPESAEMNPDKNENGSEEPNEYLDMVEKDGAYGFEREKISAPPANTRNESGARPTTGIAANGTPGADIEPAPESADAHL